MTVNPYDKQVTPGANDDVLDNEPLDLEDKEDDINPDDLPEDDNPEDKDHEDKPEEDDKDPEANEPEDKDPEETKKKQVDDSTPWVKQRLARAERSYERKFMEEAASMSDGVQVDRREIPAAVRLWNTLKHNPEVSKLVEEVLQNANKEGKLRSLREVSPEARFNAEESKLAIREARFDLKTADPIFRQHEKAIMEFAEDEGFTIRNKQDLRNAYRAWRGENAHLLKADAQKREQEKQTKAKETKQKAALESRRTPVKGAPITDYRKASARDILKSEGMSLFSED